MKRILRMFMVIILILSIINVPIDSKAQDSANTGQGLMGEFYKVEQGEDRYDISVFTFEEENFKGEKIMENFDGYSLIDTFNQVVGTSDFITARFTGTIVPEYTEEYTFHMVGDDGFRLWIDDELIIDFWKQEWEVPQTSTPIALEAGNHYDIKIEYLQGWGGAWLKMEWESESQDREIVPKSALYPSIERLIDNKKFDLDIELQKTDYLIDNFSERVTSDSINKLKAAKQTAKQLLSEIDEKNISDEKKLEVLTEEVESLSIARVDFMKDMGVTSSTVHDKFNNPLYQGQDPFVTYHEGFYYFVSSSNLDSNNKVYVSKSRTLTDQGEKIMVFDSEGTQTRIFAPELFFIDGKWYIYYCADVEEYDWQHMPVVLESKTDDPQGEYEYKGVLFTGDEDGVYRQANDFTVFEHEGDLYAVWGTLGEGEPLGPGIVKMDSPTKITNPRSMLSEVGGGEGPRVLQKDGKIFITLSEGDYQSDGYRLSYIMYEKGDILDPKSWTRKENVFVSTNDVSGPGRAGFVKSVDGTEDWMIYHSRVYKGTSRNSWRQVNLKKFAWNEDGTPNFGKPVSPGKWQDLPSGDPGQGDMYQAEDAIFFGDITTDNTAKGFQGTGYINLPNRTGSEVSFVVNAEESGDYIVGLRYAYGVRVDGEYTDGSTVQLPGRARVNVYVNGKFAKTINPDKTEINWDEWFTGSERLNLEEGKNVISYRIDSDSIGNVNLDYITMYKADVPNPIDPIEIDVTELEQLIEQAKKITNEEGQYTKDSLSALLSEISAAESVLKTIKTEEELERVVSSLQAAIDGLKPVDVAKIDVTELEKLIEQAKAITNEKGKYTEDSFNALLSEISASELALKTIKTEEELIRAISSLQSAIDGLKPVDVAEIDVTELEKLIEQAKAITNEEGKYTEDSFNALLSEINAAESALKTIETKKELAATVSSLQAAIDGLETVKKDPAPKDQVGGKEIEKEGETLPTTATSMYTILLAGFVLMVLGAISFVMIRMRRCSSS